MWASVPQSGVELSLSELAMPDLDLIKQVEQECAIGTGGQSLARAR
jgi:hypothetical protein